ncbi:MAG: UDP-N-acetylglucosamine--N-acetylmuramyl-(pentapeptide) pyrophosphoryl-undecaprenol N-acetylglucosamine transferase [Thermoleophilia bacterium]|nr:UDP-N-acetylglucosamine--N-acetylmuramyl-(pentapeptide) pyrophosphoryl-undecaprenol N-acetylglucosamine transferase [Thermoleophilia bacterium]
MIAAGGTAGHLVPALALAGALTDRGAQVSFIGTGRGLEKELVPQAGYELDLADLRGLDRHFSLQLFLFAWSLIKGGFDCFRILGRRRPDVVVGGGGYVSWAPVFTAFLRRTPTLIVELDSHMGLANRALAPFARRVALSFAIPGRQGAKYLMAGRPMSRQLLDASAAEGRRRFGLRTDRPVVLVSGGSLGARSINLACVEAFGVPELDFQLVHVSGKRDYDLVRQMLDKSGADPENYHLLDYTVDLPLATAAADLVIGRSGASVLEVAALGKPALLIPYPHATADHQLKNAEWMAETGAAEIILDGDLDGAMLKQRVETLLGDGQRLAAMAAASSVLGKHDGALRIADEIFVLAGR